MCSSLLKDARIQGNSLNLNGFKDVHPTNGVTKQHIPIPNQATAEKSGGVPFSSTNTFSQHIGLSIENGMLKPKS